MEQIVILGSVNFHIVKGELQAEKGIVQTLFYIRIDMHCYKLCVIMK